MGVTDFAFLHSHYSTVERDLQTFPGLLCNFSLLLLLLTHFAFIFFAVWSVSLSCEQSENNHFFRFKARTKIPTFSLIFALSEYEQRTLRRHRATHNRCAIS